MNTMRIHRYEGFALLLVLVLAACGTCSCARSTPATGPGDAAFAGPTGASDDDGASEGDSGQQEVLVSLADAVAERNRNAAIAAIDVLVTRPAIEQRNEWFALYERDEWYSLRWRIGGPPAMGDMIWILEGFQDVPSMWISLAEALTAHASVMEPREEPLRDHDRWLNDLAFTLSGLVVDERVSYRLLAVTPVPAALDEISLGGRWSIYFILGGLYVGAISGETAVPDIFDLVASAAWAQHCEPLMYSLATIPSLLAVEALFRLTQIRPRCMGEFGPGRFLWDLVEDMDDTAPTTTTPGANQARLWAEWYERHRPFLFVEPGPREPENETWHRRRPRVAVHREWMEAGAIPWVIPYGDPAYGSPSFPPSRFEDWDEHRDEYPYDTWYVWNKLDEPVRQGVLTLQVPE